MNIFRYLIENYQGSTDTKWWNSQANGAAHIDFTKSDATDWYINRLKRLQDEAGIDSFKFDAGETSWAPSVSQFKILFCLAQVM